eukprot:3147076-Rhodomonas_salina.1
MYGSKQLVYRMASATQGVVTGTVMSVSGYQGGPAVVSMGAKYGACPDPWMFARSSVCGVLCRALRSGRRVDEMLFCGV